MFAFMHILYTLSIIVSEFKIFDLPRADMEAAGDFVTFFQQFIEDNNYTLNQIFNCDETGLSYKLLPENTLASSFEISAPGRKKQKERVTINACSNVLGMINLPLLLIGKYQNPRCFKILTGILYLYIMLTKAMHG